MEENQIVFLAILTWSLFQKAESGEYAASQSLLGFFLNLDLDPSECNFLPVLAIG